MKEIIERGATSQIVHVFIPDSTSTTGAGKTGLTFNSASLKIVVMRPGEASATKYLQSAGNIEDITTLGTYAAPTAGKCRFKEIDATDLPGWYEIHFADALYNTTSSRRSLGGMISGASGVAPTPFAIQLADPVRGVASPTALPNAAAEAAGGLFTRGTGAGQINQQANGQIDSNLERWLNVAPLALSSQLVQVSVGALQAAVITAASIATDAITAAKIAADAITSSKIADGAFTAAKFAAGAFDAVWTVATRTLTSVADSAGVTTLLGKFTGITVLAEWLGLIAGKQTGNATARTELRATGAGSGTFDETTDSQEALRDRGDAAWTTATGFSTHTAADVWAVGTRTLTAFDAAFKTGYSLSAAGVQAIWDALTSALTTVGSIGKLLVDNIDAAISSRLSTAGYTAPPTVGQIADQVWDETLADHLGAGSTGNALNAAGSAGDPWSTALPGAYGAGTAGKIVGDNVNATISSRSSHSAADVWAVGTRTLTSFGTLVADTAAAVWAAVTRTLTAATNITSTGGTTVPQTGDSFARLGAPAGVSVSADVAAVKGDTAAIKAKTDNLPADPADASDIAASFATVNTKLDTIDDFVDTEVVAIINAIAALNNVSAADVLAQVNAALAATIADSVPADGTRPSISSGIYMLVQFMLERQVSGTAVSVKKPDGSTQLFALTLNDATSPTSITRSA